MKIKMKTERFSYTVLYALIVLTILIFGLFYLIGYERPFEDSSGFNAPLLSDVLLVFVALLMLAVIAISIWSVAGSLKRRRKDQSVINGIPAARLSYGMAVFTVVLLLITFLFGSSSSIIINAAPFTDVFWLKTADMFVSSSLVLILLALCAVAYGYTRYRRKK